MPCMSRRRSTWRGSQGYASSSSAPWAISPVRDKIQLQLHVYVVYLHIFYRHLSPMFIVCTRSVTYYTYLYTMSIPLQATTSTCSSLCDAGSSSGTPSYGTRTSWRTSRRYAFKAIPCMYIVYIVYVLSVFPLPSY